MASWGFPSLYVCLSFSVPGGSIVRCKGNYPLKGFEGFRDTLQLKKDASLQEPDISDGIFKIQRRFECMKRFIKSFQTCLVPGLC